MDAGCVGSEPRAARLGKGVRGGGEGILGLGTAYSLPGNKIGIWVRWWFRRGVWAPTRGLAMKGFLVALASAVPLYLPEATSGCPSSARAGAPVGAKEVYSVPSAHTSQRLKDCLLYTSDAADE